MIRISREADVPAEIYHLKAAGEANWPKMDRVIEMIEAARAEGLRITADMYTYTAGSTGLNAAMPPWALEGGYAAFFARLGEPAERARIKQAMHAPATDWESLYQAAGSADRVLLVGFKNEALKPLTGRTLAEVADMRGTDPVRHHPRSHARGRDARRRRALPDVGRERAQADRVALGVVRIGRRVDGPRRRLPEVVDAPARGTATSSGCWARYVREEQVIPLEEAVHRLTGLPAGNLELVHRGRLIPGAFADVVVFDPETVADRATFELPISWRWASSRHVFVNGGQAVGAMANTRARSRDARCGDWEDTVATVNRESGIWNLDLGAFSRPTTR